MESIVHYKLYKKGKLWCAMALSVVALGFGLANGVQPVHAAEAATTSSEVATSSSNAAVTSTNTAQASNSETDQVSTATVQKSSTSTVVNADGAGVADASNTAVSSSPAVASSVTNSTANSSAAANNSSQVVTNANRDSETQTSNASDPVLTGDESVPVNGYATNNGAKVYYQNSKLANGYLNDGTNWYFFKNGVKQSDVQKWDDTYYYFDHTTYQRVDNNYVKSNWGDYYLFGKDGKIQTDVQQWAGSYYYFDHKTYLRVDNNYMKSRWGDYYLFGNNGRILNDVQQWAGSYYYFDHNTYLRVNNSYLKSRWGSWYLFGNNGRVASGFANWDNRTYYFNPITHLKETNTYVKDGNNTYWLDGNGVMRTQSWQIEKAIAIGMSLIGKSPYDWGGGRTPASIAARSFDCSSFIHYIFASVGINLGNYSGATTYTEIKLGRGVSWANMRRGDIFFMNNVGHVGMYLGNGLFLHDSPHSSTGGVGINNLSDVNSSPALHGKTWAQIADGVVRRIV